MFVTVLISTAVYLVIFEVYRVPLFSCTGGQETSHKTLCSYWFGCIGKWKSPFET